MRIGRLHVITDTTIQSRFDHAELARRAIEGGADCVQFRQKDGSARAMIRDARRVAEICQRARIPFIVNDRVDVAIAADADGVHLGRDDFPIRLARTLLGPHRVIGGSAGTIEEALAGIEEGADYLGCGPAFATATKADAGGAIGPAGIAEIASRSTIPVIGIGAIHAGNAIDVLRAGAYGIAVISAVCGAVDPAESALELRMIIDGHLAGQRG